MSLVKKPECPIIVTNDWFTKVLMLIHGELLDMLTHLNNVIKLCDRLYRLTELSQFKVLINFFCIFNIDKCVTSLPDVLQGRRLYINQQLEGEYCRLDTQPNISNDESNQQF